MLLLVSPLSSQVQVYIHVCSVLNQVYFSHCLFGIMSINGVTDVTNYLVNNQIMEQG